MNEQRSAPRKASLEPCSIEMYAAGKGPFPSRVINYSAGGLMVELDHPLAKGEPVKIRFRPGTENAQRSAKRTASAWSAGARPRRDATRACTAWECRCPRA